LFTIKRNLIFMNNLYHKVAVASVCTALSFALGANKDAEAATFSSNLSTEAGYLTFQAIDGGSFGSFDTRGDRVTNVYPYSFYEGQPHTWHDEIGRTDTGEVAALVEYPFSSIIRRINSYRENYKITSITNAVLQIYVSYWLPYSDSAFIGAFGYIGNGIAEASDFEAGVFLDSKEITDRGGTWHDFNVTPFVKQIFGNNNEFAGFALRSLNQHRIYLPGNEGIIRYPPSLIVTGEIEEVGPKPVPEPTTIFGSAIVLSLGGWLKRKKSSQQNKTTSQH
jgi:hypothetical protein